MFLAPLLTFGTLQQPVVTWKLDTALVVSGVVRGGRVPASEDPILAEILDGWTAPKEGDVVKANGADHKWETIKVGKDGTMQGDALDGAYVDVHVDSQLDGVQILTAAGHSVVYVNGEIHSGDPYGYGYLSIPVRLHRGDNELLFQCSRGSLAARLEEPKAAQFLNLRDLTTPDVLTDDKGSLLAALPIVNAEDHPVDGLSLRATADGVSATVKLPRIPAMGPRKAAFQLPVPANLKPGDLKVALELIGGGKTLDQGTITVRVLAPTATHKRTFVSAIDGSVQYYAVNPAQKPSKDNALILSLHGASVEAIGQAQAYSNKDWCTLVAATNRRPYGFDWEDWGRMDALEVLGIAKKTILHDPSKVDLTGHSMGGHGTWSVGTLYPELFASIAPSAGWISFWSYAGGYAPSHPDAMDALFRRATDASDTLGRKRNLLSEKEYVLHGDADDNVPVTEARTMKGVLTDLGADFQYHEQPGAGHWWGNQCVDWPPIFDMIKGATLPRDDDPNPVDFTTPNPAVSDRLRWIRVVRQDRLDESEVQAKVDRGVISVTTSNVAAFEIDKVKAPVTEIEIDGQRLSSAHLPALIEKRNGTWQRAPSWNPDQKGPWRNGPFKNAFQRHMIFVVGTAGSEEETRTNWMLARFEAEGWGYRGNGAVDVVTDREYLLHRSNRRNPILFGTPKSNSAWGVLLKDCPAPKPSSDEALLVCYPLKGTRDGMVAAIAPGGPKAAQVLARLPLFLSGVEYPDFTILNSSLPRLGIKAITTAGNFDANWQIDPKDFERR